MSDAGRTRRRLTRRERLIGVVVGIAAAVGLMVALNWTELTTTPVAILRMTGDHASPELSMVFPTCSHPYSIHVDESADQVEVLVLLHAANVADCELERVHPTVILEGPLDYRDVVDGSNDTEVIVSIAIED